MSVADTIKNIFKNPHSIEKLRRGDPQAWKRFFDEYYPMLFRFILLRVGNRETAQDLTSDVLVNIVRYIKDSQKNVDNLRAFSYTTARHKVIDYYRSRDNNQPTVNIDDIAESTITDHKHILKDIEHAHEIAQLLGVLNPEEKELVIMRYIDGLSHKEIGLIMEKSETSVRVQIHRIMSKIKEQKTNIIL